jgi:acetyl-CoA carboxylase alpha subunit
MPPTAVPTDTQQALDNKSLDSETKIDELSSDTKEFTQLQTAIDDKYEAERLPRTPSGTKKRSFSEIDEGQESIRSRHSKRRICGGSRA